MGTATNVPAPQGAVEETAVPTAVASGDLSSDKTTYRAYVKLNDKGEIVDKVAKAEVNNQTNWKKLEEEGWQQWNENIVVRYNVKSIPAAQHLVPDEGQFVYVFQTGLNYIQNSKANAIAVESKEGDDAAPAYNNEEIDLREYINIPPSKRALTPLEKLERLLAGLGLDAAAKAALLAQAAKKQSTPLPELSMGE
jgi:hypothetical protein